MNLLLIRSTVPSVPLTTKSKDSKKQIVVRSIGNDKKSLSRFEANFHRLPPSPANLLKPDRFQFYTYNERGDMITKQMTMQEIQALIAGGGPDHSNTNVEVQEPQKVEDILTGGKKVCSDYFISYVYINAVNENLKQKFETLFRGR